MKTEKNASAADRLLERFGSSGCTLDGFTDTEIMCVVMSACASRGRDVEALAEELTKSFGNIGNVLKASTADLIGTGHLKPAEVMKLKLVNAVFVLSEIQKLGKTIPVNDERLVRRYLRLLYYGCTEEIIYVIPLKKGRLGTPLRLATGSETKVVIDPGKLIELLKQIPFCEEFVMCHNHPKETSTPSERDISTTKEIFYLTAVNGLTLKKHYVVGTDGVSEVPFDNNLLRYVFQV